MGIRYCTDPISVKLHGIRHEGSDCSYCSALYALCFSKELQSVYDFERISDSYDRSGDRLLEYQKTVDDKIVYILHRMAIYIELEDKTDYTGSCFDELDAMLVNLKKEALRYMNNHLITEDDYYYEYMQMRARQCVILKRIYADIIRLTTTPEQGKALADFIRQTADEFAEQNNVETLLSELERLHHHYEQQQLPVTRQEFENRSMLYHILEDMKAFLDIKKDFITAR